MLKLPKGTHQVDLPVAGSRIPKAEEIAILPQKLLAAIIKVSTPLRDVVDVWAVGGDAMEIMQGVNIQKIDSVEILTTAKGCAEICDILKEYVTLAPAPAEKKLPRDADIDGKMYPVFIKSTYAELVVNGANIQVYGDEQIKVGDWEWGDPIVFEPNYIYVVGEKIPVVPLRLMSELDLGLGWLDRVGMISDAQARAHHPGMR